MRRPLPILALSLTIGCPSEEPSDSAPSDTAAPAPVDTSLPAPVEETGTPTDTGAPPVPTGPVTVEAWRLRSPLVDVAISVADASGAFVETVRTDADGRVTIDDFPSGGSVTLYETFDGSRIYNTAFDVQIGDTKVLGQSNRVTTGEVTGEVRALDGADHLIGAVDCSDLENRGNAGPLAFGALGPDCEAGMRRLGVLAEDVNDVPIGVSFGQGMATGTPPNLVGEMTMSAWTTDFGTIEVTLLDDDNGLASIRLGAVRGAIGSGLLGLGRGAALGGGVSFSARSFRGFDRLLVEQTANLQGGGRSVRFDEIAVLPATGAVVQESRSFDDLLVPPQLTASLETASLMSSPALPMCGTVASDLIGASVSATHVAPDNTQTPVFWSFHAPPSANRTFPEVGGTLPPWPEGGTWTDVVIESTFLASEGRDYGALAPEVVPPFGGLPSRPTGADQTFCVLFGAIVAQ